MKPLVVLLSAFVFSFGLPHGMSSEAHHGQKPNNNGVNVVSAKEIPELNKRDTVVISSEFMNRLKQKTNNQFEVIRFHTKNEMIHYLSDIASPDVAAYYVDSLYQEKDGKLFLYPTDLPPWFDGTKPFKIEKLTNTLYHVVQHNTSDLYGKYDITLGFEYKEGKWRLTFASVS